MLKKIIIGIMKKAYYNKHTRKHPKNEGEYDKRKVRLRNVKRSRFNHKSRRRRRGADKMAVYQIVQIGEDILREKSQEVTKITPNIHKLLDNMAETMYQANGVGLAAPQIGVLKKVVVIDSGEGLIELINPVITEKIGEELGEEACLSVPNVVGDVRRAKKVVAQALNRDGELIEYEAEGLMARAFQHEIDHLNGILFVDIADKLYDRK